MQASRVFGPIAAAIAVKQRRGVGERHRHLDPDQPRPAAPGMVGERIADRAIDLRQA